MRLNCQRHIQQQRSRFARQCLGQADTLWPQDKPRHHHQSHNIPARTDINPENIDNPRILGLPARPHAGLGTRQAHAASIATPIDASLSLQNLRFRYRLSGTNPPSKPLRAFDDGEKVYIQFPAGIAQGELPPLFVIGAQGDGQLVNYRFRSPYTIVDRLFGAAELRLGADKGNIVRIERTDGARRNRP